MNRRAFLKTLGWGAVCVAGLPPALRGAEPKKGNLNILLFTADDLNCDTVGCFGGKVPCPRLVGMSFSLVWPVYAKP